MEIEYAYIMKSLMGGIEYCGDLIYTQEYDNKYFFAAIDVLGHGSDARKLAIKIELYLHDHYKENLLDIMTGLHNNILGSRGAVASLCLIDNTGLLQHVGIGNISVRIKGSELIRLISRDGIVGYGVVRPTLSETSLKIGDIVLLHSDGIQNRFRWDDCKDLISESAESLALGILNRYQKRDDDASCLAIKVN